MPRRVRRVWRWSLFGCYEVGELLSKEPSWPNLGNLEKILAEIFQRWGLWGLAIHLNPFPGPRILLSTGVLRKVGESIEKDKWGSSVFKAEEEVLHVIRENDPAKWYWAVLALCISKHPSLLPEISFPLLSYRAINRFFFCETADYQRSDILSALFFEVLSKWFTMAALKDTDSKDVISAHVENPPVELEAREDPVDILAHDTNVYFTVEEEKRVLRKIDMRVLPLMLGAYFLQQLDKSSLSYTSVFNIQKDAGLHGRQYSWLGSILYIAQLVMQPLGAYFLVKLPTGKLISTAIFFWGVTMCGMAGCRNFKQLLATRFLLGSFESLIGKFLWNSSHQFQY